MPKLFKLLLIALLGITILFIIISDRNLDLGIVNANTEIVNVEIIINGQVYKSLKLEQSIIPMDFIEIPLKPGMHIVEIISNDCGTKDVFKFFNLIGYDINVEYQGKENDICKTIIRQSHFGLIF